jgi:5-methylcytosine-specific restriction enzyme subunit McrC
LESAVDGSSLGFLRPDALVLEQERAVGVLDAKYKRLHPSPPAAPYGPQREDLYQLAAYMARFGASTPEAWGMLVYPVEPGEVAVLRVDRLNPWLLKGSKVQFVTLPHEMKKAVEKLSSAIRGQALLSGRAAQAAA